MSLRSVVDDYRPVCHHQQLPALCTFGHFYLACLSAIPACQLYILLLLILFLYFNGYLETSYIKMYWTDLHQIFRFGMRMVGFGTLSSLVHPLLHYDHHSNS